MKIEGDRKTIVSVSICSTPDFHRIDEIGERLGLNRQEMFERYAIMPSDRNNIKLAELVGENVRWNIEEVRWPPILNRIVGIGVAVALPEDEKKYRVRRRAFFGSDEASVIAAFSAFSFASLSAQVKNGTDPFPTFVGAKLRSEIVGPILARAELLMGLPDGSPEKPEQDGRAESYLRSLIRIWYDESDKWGKSRPNYMMDRDPHVIDIERCEAGGAWSGRPELIAALSPIRSKEPRNPLKELSLFIESDGVYKTQMFWDCMAKRLLFESGRNLERYVRHSDLAFGTDMLRWIEKALEYNLWSDDKQLPRNNEELKEIYGKAGEVAFCSFGKLSDVGQYLESLEENERLRTGSAPEKAFEEIGFNGPVGDKPDRSL